MIAGYYRNRIWPPGSHAGCHIT